MKKLFLGITVVLIILSFSLAGCGKPALAALEDSRWILISYGETENPKYVLPDTEITARFNSGTKKVRGSSGCNTYTGEYEVDENYLTIKGSFAVTEMWCGREIDDQETEFLDIFLNAESFQVGGDSLVIHCGTNMLNFERE
jgi:heat shock protein HslJ